MARFSEHEDLASLEKQKKPFNKTYVIKGEPVAWSSHRGFGKKSYNPHRAERVGAQWELKIQHQGLPLLDQPLRVDFYFEMPIPKSLPKHLLKLIDSGKKVYHTVRKDRTNLIKFAEDCLTDIVIKDDNIICTGLSEKYYSKEPKTVIVVSDEIYSFADRLKLLDCKET